VIDWIDACRRTFGPLIAARRAGVISEDESGRLERHLATCARCRSLAGDLDALRDVLVEAARSGSLDHPEPVELAALATNAAGLGDADRERLERHLDACPICRSEWNAARSFAPPALAREPAHAPGRTWAWFGAGFAVAAVACSALLLLPRWQATGAVDLRASAEPVQLHGSQHRAGAAPTALRIPSSGDVLVSLTVEAGPGSKVMVELRRSDGSVVTSRPFTVPDPSGILFVSVPASMVPRGGGGFHVVVEDTGEVFDYPFRVANRGE
jgi:hypothetical protein